MVREAKITAKINVSCLNNGAKQKQTNELASRLSLRKIRVRAGGRHEAKKDFDIVKKFLRLKMLEIIYRTDVYTGILFFEPPNLQK